MKLHEQPLQGKRPCLLIPTDRHQAEETSLGRQDDQTQYGPLSNTEQASSHDDREREPPRAEREETDLRH